MQKKTAGDEGFSKQLANNGDIYVNDAFGTAHRAHASTTIIAKYFSDNKCFGSLLATEIESIDKVLNNSEKTCLSYFRRGKSIFKNYCD